LQIVKSRKILKKSTGNLHKDHGENTEPFVHFDGRPAQKIAEVNSKIAQK